MITSWNMGFLSVFNWFLWLIFSVNILCIRGRVINQSCWIQLPFSIIRERVGERIDYPREEAWGWLFEGGDYLKHFHRKGAIVQAGRLIEKQLLFEEIQQPVSAKTNKQTNKQTGALHVPWSATQPFLARRVTSERKSTFPRPILLAGSLC